VKISAALEGVNRLGFDTSPFIYFIEEHSIYFVRTIPFFKVISEGAVLGFGSMMTLTEVLTQPIKQNKPDLVSKYENILLDSVGLEILDVNKAIARRAAELRARYGLRTPDAMQIATALSQNCEAFLTNDTGFKRVTELRVLLIDELELDDPPL